MNKFECSVVGGIFGGWMQLMLGYDSHAFYTLGVMQIIVMIGIFAYLREIYMREK